MRRLFLIVFGLLISSFLPSAYAQDLPAANGTVLLTLSGHIKHTNAVHNGQPVAEFDGRLLDALPSAVVKTHTKWTHGVETFRGPLVRTVLKRVGAEGSEVIAGARDNYTVKIPMSDFTHYRVLLARSMNGQPLPANRAPLWIIYPFDQSPALAGPATEAKSIWSVKALEVK